MENFKKITTYFKPILKKYTWYILATMFLWGVGTLARTIVAPLFYKNLINEATYQYSQSIFSIQPLITILLIIGGIVIFSSTARVSGSYLLAFFENKMMTDIHFYSFQKVAQQTYHFFSNNFTGTLVSKASSMSKNFKDMLEVMLFGFFLLSLNIIASVVILMKENFIIGCMFIIITLIFILLSLFLSKKQSQLQILRASKESLRSGIISDIFSNNINTKIFSRESSEENYYYEALNALAHARKQAWLHGDNTRVIKSILLIIFEIGVMFFALTLFIDQSISIGTLVLIQTYVLSIAYQVWDLDKMLNNFVTAISESVDAIDVLTAPILISDPKTPVEPSMTQGEIIFNAVSFTYPGGDHVFENFALTIPVGQSVGIVGKSGSGKTTITKLLLRFYDIDAGAIKIDGQDIRDVRQDDLRNAIAYIPQESILFHRSIKENIGYSNPGATDEEIIQAAKFAHADEFIAGFEYGYDTKVGERGVKLSGGQRQRIAIARAMLKSAAPILIMDEATSSLDTLSEQYIQDSFEKLMKGRTTIVIAHRLSTIQKMDRIIVLDKGEVVEDGSHTELIARKGYYAELWNSQTDGFIED